MKLQPKHIYHIYNRGNNRQTIFFTHSNYVFFLQKLKTHLAGTCDILAFCLMPNHFHLLISTPEDFNTDAFYNSYKTLLSSYTRAINRQENRKGSLFQQNSKSKSVSDWYNYDYAFTCLNYIHQNPLNAGLVKKLEDWKYSSFVEYLGLKSNPICNLKDVRQFFNLPQSKAEFIIISYQTLTSDLIDKVR